MATAAPKQSERKMEASSNLFEGLQTVNINLPIAPSHPVILSPSQGVEESDTAEESTSLLGDTSRSNVIEKAQVQDTSSEKFSKLYASEADIHKKSSNSYPTLPSMAPSRSLLPAGMPSFATYMPQPQGASPLRESEEESEFASLLGHDPLSSRNAQRPAPSVADTRAVSSSYHLPQPQPAAQTQSQSQALNRLNPSQSYLPNSTAYSTPVSQRTVLENKEAESKEPDSALVDELVSENWRLSQEVESLRTILALSPTAAPPQASQTIIQQPQQVEARQVVGTVSAVGPRHIAPYSVSSTAPVMHPMNQSQTSYSQTHIPAATSTSISSSTNSSSSSGRAGWVSNGVYRPVATSSSAANEIELRDRSSTAGVGAVSASLAPSAPSMDSVTRTQTGPQTAAGTQAPPAEGMKYLCCGGCRQWLMSPVAAEYVYCPTCHNVNQCPRQPNIRPAVSYRDANGNVIPAESFEWYAPFLPLMDCVKNLFR